MWKYFTVVKKLKVTFWLAPAFNNNLHEIENILFCIFYRWAQGPESGLPTVGHEEPELCAKSAGLAEKIPDGRAEWSYPTEPECPLYAEKP